MPGDEVRTVFEQMRPQDEIDHLCVPCGMIEGQRKLPLGMLVRVQDGYLIDSTTVRGRDALIEDFRGTGASAVLTVHKVCAVGCGALVPSHCSPV